MASDSQLPTCHLRLPEAQWSTGEQAPIPPTVVNDVVRAYQRFKRTCTDFGVSDDNVRVIGTEATRQAINSEDFRAQIHKATGWTVEMLPKEEEGRVGAMGVVSSFSTMKGLMMDLGGGSTQITWLDAEHGQVRMSDAGSVSMPYGAAALSRRIAEANTAGGNAMDTFRNEVVSNLKAAVAKIEIPAEFSDPAKNPGGITLHLSGGGFRGWGFVLMSQHPVQPYPIPIINGFAAPANVFVNTQIVMAAAANQDNIFRVSERRASQVPAVACLVSCLVEALPAITTVKFAQGGVREGALFKDLVPEKKAEHPLVTATIPYASVSSPNLVSVIESTVPPSDEETAPPVEITPQLRTALGQGLYLFNHLSKDLQAAAALRSTTTGILAGTHGASHNERAALAIMLCESCGGVGSLAPGDASFYNKLLELLEPSAAWWCKYYGKIAGVVAEVYPAGVVRQGQEKVNFHVKWAKHEKKHEKKDGHTLHITVDMGKDDESVLQAEGLQKSLKGVEKLGKKKNWANGEGGYKVELKIKSAGGESLPESHFED
jgi:retrograde regulation protein 2